MTDQDTGFGGSDAPESLSPDRIFELLADRQRRSVITHLQTVDGAASLREVAERIATEKNQRPIEQSPDRADDVLCALYHWHVPKLAAADVVAFDPDRQRVEPAANFEPLAEFSHRISMDSGGLSESATGLS